MVCNTTLGPDDEHNVAIINDEVGKRLCCCWLEHEHPGAGGECSELLCGDEIKHIGQPCAQRLFAGFAHNCGPPVATFSDLCTLPARNTARSGPWNYAVNAKFCCHLQ